jgi:hypothetical protein
LELIISDLQDAMESEDEAIGSDRGEEGAEDDTGIIEEQKLDWLKAPKAQPIKGQPMRCSACSGKLLLNSSTTLASVAKN